ncbi:MAG TPA: C40 family peptidase, partial [Smithella sp.]|nr:C40 family peptidase [Smithella sp.]
EDNAPGQGEYLGKWNSENEAESLIQVATGFLGMPYRFGGSSLEGKGIDCSAFVQKIYRMFNVELPRSAREQAKVGVKIKKDELTEGDLVFFRTYRPFGHVGIYIGNNEFVHASTRGKIVRIDSMDMPFYKKRFQRAVRVKAWDKEGT